MVLRVLACLFSLPWGLFLGSRPSRPLTKPTPRPVATRTEPDLVFGFCWSEAPAPQS
jgi:hypothetical protein